METDPSTWIDALEASHGRLRSLVEPLDADGVRRHAYPSEWSIAQVLSHLGSGAEIFRRFLAAGLDGGEPPGSDEFPPIWSAWNAKRPEAQAADALAADRALLDDIAALDAAERGRVRLAMFGMDLDIVGLLRMRLSEHALHTWDVAVALDDRAILAPDAVALIIDTLGPLAARSGKRSGPPRRVRVRTTDPARDLLLDIGDSVSLTEPGSPTADSVTEAGSVSEPGSLTEAGGDGAAARLRLPAEAFVRLVYGRLDPAHTPSVDVDGIELDELRGVFPGF